MAGILHVDLPDVGLVKIPCDSCNAQGVDTGCLEAWDAQGRRVANFKVEFIKRWWFTPGEEEHA